MKAAVVEELHKVVCKEVPDPELLPGSLKIKVHHRVVERLFEEKGQVLGLEEIYKVAESISKQHL